MALIVWIHGTTHDFITIFKLSRAARATCIVLRLWWVCKKLEEESSVSWKISIVRRSMKGGTMASLDETFKDDWLTSLFNRFIIFATCSGFSSIFCNDETWLAMNFNTSVGLVSSLITSMSIESFSYRMIALMTLLIFWTPPSAPCKLVLFSWSERLMTRTNQR